MTLDQLCPWEAPTYLIFSSNVPELFYYSHFTAILGCLLLSILIILSPARKHTTSLLLLGLFLLFSLWSFTDLVVWATNIPSTALFWWALIVLIEPMIFVVAFYLFYKTIFPNKTTLIPNILVFVTLLPLILLSPTDLNLSGINLYDCVATEGPLALWYTYILEFTAVIAIVAMGLWQIIFPSMPAKRKETMYLTMGLILFLGAFSLGNIIGSFGGTSYDWEISQYGLFGMPIFIGFLTYLIVKFNAFNVKLLGAQALVVALWFLVGSLLFVAKSIPTRSVAGITLVFTSVAGYFLVRSVKKEVQQREEIAKLAETLAQANDQLKVLDRMKSEFVSIASHQLRSPLTSIRGYASMLAEGSYGKLPAKSQEVAERIAESAKYMALSVEDYLNVSRIEAGNMKYEMSDFNLKETAERIVDELRPVAIKKGLVMVFRSQCEGSSLVHADIGKTRQIIMNLLDNSMKYTPKGMITVVAHDDLKKKKMYITIHDTGVGMSKETQEEVFEKFVRAKNANNVNVTGTGLGLYVAKKMLTDMGGKVTAESEGEGKGSTFIIEFPLLTGPVTQK